MTKKQIYAKHGITFKSGKILYRGKWIAELLKKGNSKTGETVYTWSTLPGTDGTCVCDCDGCYAEEGFYNMPSVRASLELNMHIVEDDIDFFYNAVSAQLECMRDDIHEIRIHAAGDFATTNMREYAQTWHTIVKENPSYMFWTYTKVRELETLFDDLPNGNIVKSVINGIGVNFGHIDYIIKAYRKLKSMGANVWICRCGIDKNQHCANCKHCSTADFVLFVEHSTGYNALKDPLYPTLVEIINQQAA